MFWRITGLSASSPVDSILDKEGFTLEELLDEDEIIQECKAHNTRLINFLREKNQVAQLLHYIIEEIPEDAEKKRTFKFPFLACEIFTCEVDTILETLVGDDELMSLLFSFLQPSNCHSTLLAGYFSKVVVCLMLRKTGPFMKFIQTHREIFFQLVDLIGITSIMEVLIRLIGADENVFSKCMDSMQWLEDIDVLETIVDKFSSSDCPEVHANAAESLCAVTRYAPPGLAAKLSNPSFIGRLLRHALEDSRPNSVLFHALTVCISLLDPKRLVPSSYYIFPSQVTPGYSVAANPKSVDSMLERLGDLLKLLTLSPPDRILPTTYGSLQPPLGKLRLKIVEFISVLLSISNEAAEMELTRLGAIQLILNLFFEYPFNNFLHHHVENILGFCLESKRSVLIEHLLGDCNIIGRILEAEKNTIMTNDSNKPTVPSVGRLPPRVGNIGHITRISNRLIQLGNTDNTIQTYMQANREWVDWYKNLLQKRSVVENVNHWDCGRPNSFQDRAVESDDEDFKIRDYDVAVMANNLTRAFQYSNYNNDDREEVNTSLEHDDEDVYFDDESAEVVISSLRLGDGQESSLFTNSNWFAFDDSRAINECSTSLFTSNSHSDESDEVVIVDEDEVTSTRSSDVPEPGTSSCNPENSISERHKEALKQSTVIFEDDKSSEWATWDEVFESSRIPEPLLNTAELNGNLKAENKSVDGSPSSVQNTLASRNAVDGRDEDGLSRSLDRLGICDTSITATSS